MSIVGQTAQIDFGVTQSLANYLAFGIDPGTFGMALLKGDRDGAYIAAHPLLHDEEHQLLGGHGVEDVVATMFEVTESSIPQFARGEDIDRWMAHKGLSGAPEPLKVMAKLGIENDVIWNYIVKNHPEVIRGEKTPA